MKKKIKWIGLSFLILALCAGGIWWYLEARDYRYTDDAFIEAYSVDLSSTVQERIVGLYVEEGDFVKKGQLIAEMQPNIILAKQDEAKANIISLQTEVSLQEAHYKKIRNNYERALRGIEDEVISAQEYDHREKDFEMATARLEKANADLDLAKTQLEVINAELSHYLVTAPIDGYISKRWIYLGDVTQPGQTMFTMYDLKNVWVTANLSEKKVAAVRIGDPVEIHVDAYSGYTFTGEVFVIKGAAASQFSLIPQDTATGNYTKVAQRIPIKMTIEPPADFPKDQPIYLFPGMSTEVHFKVR